MALAKPAKKPVKSGEKAGQADASLLSSVRESSVRLRKPSTFQQYKTLLMKDLRQEFRTREMLTSMGIYAILVLIVYGAALAQTSRQLDILQMSGGLLWALIVFTSLLGLNRSFSQEKEQGCLEGILLVPLDRSVVFLAKATSNLLFLLVVEIIAVPLFYFFFMTTVTPGETFGLIVVPLIVGTVGVAGVGTLLSTITVNTRGKDVMLAVLFIPIIFPLLYACVSCTTAVIVGADGWMDAFRVSLALAGGYDIIMILVSWVLYDFVISA
ncbi:MAG: heme exporter protein CcmB [Eggerthellaceae bacterium]|nr:heme exporter protein CcmB [Eggerthellaceae bacterium]